MAPKKDNMCNCAFWMTGQGPSSDIVISTRVRLARNLESVPFPMKGNSEQLKGVVEKVRGALKATKSIGPVDFVELSELSTTDRQVLVEEHLISTQYVDRDENKAVVFNRDKTVSIMVNEEDHLRIQAILPGLQVEDTLKLASDTDDALEETLDYAFDERLGYLSACPTNVGTGMRASVMLHLPALAMMNMTGQVFGAVSKVGLTVRGIFGEGTESSGNMVQISNQISIGRSEQDMARHLKVITGQVVDSELQARNTLLNEVRPQIEDRVYRAYGIATNARIVNVNEAFKLLSDVKLGADLGIIKGVDSNFFKELIVKIMPAHMQRYAKEIGIDADDVDAARACLMRSRMNSSEEE